MASYVAADPTQRWKAIVAVAVVHVLLALVIVSGLNVRMVGDAVEQLKIFDIAPPPPPPPPPTPPASREKAAKKPEGAPAKKAEPSPIVAPPTPLPVRSPIPAAKIAGTGNASTSGAAASGNGSGAGGSGNGTGAGDYSRFTPARLVRNLTRSDYRELAGDRMPAGRAMVSLRVEPSGAPSNCRISRSSGDSAVDGALCPLIVSRLRFRPALDDQGRPIPYQLQYVATWSL
jgi:periplasmic protein TonB